MATEQELAPVTASLVAESDRLSFLPEVVGPHFMRFEALVYRWLSNLSQDYNGGFWNYYRLSNGGFYMAPDKDAALRLVVDGNAFDGEVSSDAAGIVATLFALGQMAEEIEGSAGVDAVIDHYHQLREFASEHAEAGLIFHAID